MCGERRDGDRGGTVRTPGPAIALGLCRSVRLTRLARDTRTRFEPVPAVTGVLKIDHFAVRFLGYCDPGETKDWSFRPKVGGGLDRRHRNSLTETQFVTFVL